MQRKNSVNFSKFHTKFYVQFKISNMQYILLYNQLLFRHFVDQTSLVDACNKVMTIYLVPLVFQRQGGNHYANDVNFRETLNHNQQNTQYLVSF